MKISKKSLPKTQLELLIELTSDELKSFVESTALQISKNRNIAGFRPGKAPFDIVVKEVGEMTLYQTAANEAIDETLIKIIDDEKINLVGQPKIEVQKLAPSNPFIFKATLDLVPKIELCEYAKIKVKSMTEIKVENSEVEKVVTDLRSMRAKEILKNENEPVELGDKVELDFETFIDQVAIDGGQAKGHSLVIGKGQMIPGFEDNIIGLKKDETKEFELEFPKKYHEEKLQGKKALFKIKILTIYKIELPEVNDEFAKGFGLKNLDDLKKHLESNIKREKEMKENERYELELIEQLIDKSKFEELPDSLVEDEIHKMIHELEDNVVRQGMKFEDYLSNIKKTEADLHLDFSADAIKRVKTGLVIRVLAEKERITADEKEINDETERSLASYKFHPQYEGKLAELEQNMRSENGQRYFSNLIRNRKAMELLKEKTSKK